MSKESMYNSHEQLIPRDNTALDVSSESIATILESESTKCVEVGVDEAALVTYLTDRINNINSGSTAVIAVVGGAASGKTRLVENLIRHMDSADYIGTDDYVVGDREHRRTHLEEGDPIKKYDFELLNKKVQSIKDLSVGDTVSVPRYEQQTGMAASVGEENFPHVIGPVATLFIEGDFDPVLSPDLKIFLHVPDNVRLSNRIGRDSRFRSEQDEKKIAHNFNARQQRQHLPHTLLAAETADIIIVADPKKSNDGDVQYEFSIYEINR
jgi:uridine kinase